MPELPDVNVYVEALEQRIVGQSLEQIRLASPFLVRSVEPPLQDSLGRTVTGVRRLGKRIVIALEPDLYLVLHLMIAGRLRWRERGAAIPGRIGLAAFDFPNGTMILTEAGTKRRAALHLVRGAAGLAEHDRGGLEVLGSSLDTFAAALRAENHTLKRVLTDPVVFSGIGNAYSDEILHAARLSPFALTQTLTDDEIARLHRATEGTLRHWVERLRGESEGRFPENVTAFREGMAVHGRYRQPCPVCGSPVQRIRYAENEVNYCATCQTGGKVLADRALSRLLRGDWPRSLDEWEERINPNRSSRVRGRGGT
ncbi:MAG TPA: DNA-formamidopyrimidine glycosylase family protein [Gemmatimonadales bacterium]|nr:DNA-formamidopyrimidine glycosylase family protein [Gemmatimonadales bacterium]